MKTGIAGITLGVILLGMSGGAMAAEANVSQQEIDELKARLAVLEQRFEQQKKADAGANKKTGTQNDDWKLYGDIRVRAVRSGGDDEYHFTERLRLNLEKKFGPNATLRVRDILMNENTMGDSGSYTYWDGSDRLTTNESKDTVNKIDNAYVQFDKLAGGDHYLKVGRFGHDFGTTGYWASKGSLGMYDGLEVKAGYRDFSLAAGFGDWGGAKAHTADRIRVRAKDNVTEVQGTDPLGTTANKLEKNYFFKLGWQPSGKTAVQAWYIHEIRAKYSPLDYTVAGLGFKQKLGKNFTLAADYSRNSAVKDNPEGKVAVLTYKGANFKKPHSYGLSFYYINVDKYNVASALTKSVNIPCNDNRGLGVGFNYTLLKNVRADLLAEFNMKQKSTGDKQSDYYRFQVAAQF